MTVAHGLRGLSLRAIVLGLLIGSLTAAQNCYFGFKFGWTTMGGTTASVLGFGALRLSDAFLHRSGRRPDGGHGATPAENTVLQTCAVAAASMVGGASLPFAVFAMSDQIRKANNFATDTAVGGGSTWDPSFLSLVAFCGSLCFFGFFLAVPLRTRFVLRQKLPFPYATASAETIQGLHSGAAGVSGQKTLRLLLGSLGPALLFKAGIWFIRGFESVPIFGLEAKRRFKWKMNLSPANLGQGLIVGPRYVLSQLLGAVLASGLLLPLALAHEGDRRWSPSNATNTTNRRRGWFEKGAKGFQGPDAYYLLPAIAVIVADSVFRLLLLFLPTRCESSSTSSGEHRAEGGTPTMAEAGVAATPLSPAICSGNLVDQPEMHVHRDSVLRDDDCALSFLPFPPPRIEIEAPNAKPNTNTVSDRLAQSLGIRGEIMPFRLWVTGLTLTGLLPVVTFPLLFPRSKWYQALLAVLAGPVWSIGIGASVGATGSNMASSCGKLMIILFAASISSGGGGDDDGALSASGYQDVVPSLALGALSIAVVDAAMDLVRDFKTAHLVGASPRAMAVAQFIGAAVSCLFSSAAYQVVAAQAPSEALPATVAKAYRALAVVFAGSAGLEALPAHVVTISAVAAVLALVVDVFETWGKALGCTRSCRRCLPHSSAVGVGLYLLPGQSLTAGLGLLIKVVLLTFWSPASSRQEEQPHVQTPGQPQQPPRQRWLHWGVVQGSTRRGRPRTSKKVTRNGGTVLPPELGQSLLGQSRRRESDVPAAAEAISLNTSRHAGAGVEEEDAVVAAEAAASKKLLTIVGSGLLAGDGLGGLVGNLLVLNGVSPPLNAPWLQST